MSVSVKQMDEGFLQVTNNGIDRITLGMKFRNDMEARSLMGLLQQCAAPGITVDINSNVFLSFKLGKLIAIGRLCNLCTYINILPHYSHMCGDLTYIFGY